MKLSTANPAASMGWATCGNCDGAFLSVVGARVRCPGCGHVFCVEAVQLAKPQQHDESRPSGKQWLLRIEISAARAWAEACARRFAGGGDEVAGDVRDWLRTWQQVHALRFGQRIEFSK